jgi:UDP-glucose:(heptosyl)LPS alpha-1,3-glucosyltransferase
VRLKLFQVASALNRKGGIQRVAFALTQRFVAAGVELSTRTLHPVTEPELAGMGRFRASPRLSRLAARLGSPYLVALFVLPLFALIASRDARRRRDALRLIHGESFVGDVYVAHSCHRAAVAAKWAAGNRRWLFFPAHWLQLWREAYVFRRRRPYLIALSEGVAAEFRRWYQLPAEKIFLIPNGVDRDEFAPAPDRATLRERLGLPAEEFLLVFVAHEFERKGLRFILEGMAQSTAAQRPHLLVIGRDEPAPYCALAAELGLAERVHFLGLRENVREYYAASDLFVFLSNYESCCLVGLEALASGLPVVASSVNGIDDYVEDGENGLIVERSAAGLAGALERLLGDPALLARLGDAARPSSAPYEWDAVARRYLEVLERIRVELGR